jgi:hypothetical protein
MAKRFTATDKWDKVWHRRLPPRLKCLWDYICAKCNMAGIWEVDLGLASYQIGEDVHEDDLRAFDGKLHDLGNGKVLIVPFVEFQYGKLSTKSPVHLKVLEVLERHGVSYPIPTLAPSLAPSLQEEEEATEKEEEGGRTWKQS